MTRLPLALIGLGYGAYLLYVYAAGALYYYIHPVYLVPSVVTGLALVALALVAAVGRRRGRDPGAAARRDGHGGHSHGAEGRPSRLGLALLLLPLAVGFGLPPRPLGLSTASQRGIETSAVGRIDEGGPAVDVGLPPESYTIKDWLKALHADPEPGRHVGKPVRVVGFVYRDPRLPRDWFLVARFIVQCCAVDAQAVGLPVRAAADEVPAAGTWIAVEGHWEVAEAGGERRAVIAPTKVARTDAPAQPYLY